MSAANRLTAVAALAAALLAGCSSAGTVTVRPAPVRCSCTATARPAVTSMQLPARTSVGTGTLARAWATALLTAMGDPVSNAGIASLIAWFTAEDNHKPAGQETYGAGENNPLNVTADSGDNVGATGMEPSGAGPSHPGNLDFSPPDYGVAATAQVIATKYPVISQALLEGRGLIKNPAVSQELAEWSGGGYSSLG